jgi:hypothetical protein
LMWASIACPSIGLSSRPLRDSNSKSSEISESSRAPRRRDDPHSIKLLEHSVDSSTRQTRGPWVLRKLLGALYVAAPRLIRQVQRAIAEGTSDLLVAQSRTALEREACRHDFQQGLGEISKRGITHSHNENEL